MESDGYAVKADKIVKCFGENRAVDGVSFAIKERECYGLLGPNGAGKTTILRMVHCYYPLTSGEITVFDKDVKKEPRQIKKLIGVVPQENNLDEMLTVFENLMVYARYFDIPRKTARERAEELLTFVQLDGRRNSRIRELSSGMMRRLVIARALINRPRIIILDEPTTGLDPQARHLIWQRLRSLKRVGVTLFLTTHYMEEAAQLCDRVAVIDKGVFLVEGDPVELVRRQVGREVLEVQLDGKKDDALILYLQGERIPYEAAGDKLYLFCDDGKEHLKALLNKGYRHLLHRPATLEDLFLKLTGRGLRE
jgi:lipooligosaccharide transport system ATP-binding protein